MKILFRPLAIVTALVISYSVFGQEVAKIDTTLHEYKVEKSTSLIFGPNLSQCTTTVSKNSGNWSTKSDRAVSFHFGFTNVRKYKSELGLKTGANFSLERFAISGESASYGYLCFPIQAQYFVNRNFSVYGGFNFDIFIFELYEGDFKFKDDEVVRFWNPSLSFGIETKINKELKIFANYNLGLNNLVTSEYRDFNGYSISIDKNVIQVGISILFKEKWY